MRDLPIDAVGHEEMLLEIGTATVGNVQMAPATTAMPAKWHCRPAAPSAA